jgi:hypothetical protein
MIMLGAIKSRLFFGKLALGPKLEERVVLAMLFIAGRHQLVVKTIAHEYPRRNRIYLSPRREDAK